MPSSLNFSRVLPLVQSNLSLVPNLPGVSSADSLAILQDIYKKDSTDAQVISMRNFNTEAITRPFVSADSYTIQTAYTIRLFLAVDGKLAGVLQAAYSDVRSVLTSPVPFIEATCYLESIYVCPAFRRRAVGTKAITLLKFGVMQEIANLQKEYDSCPDTTVFFHSEGVSDGGRQLAQVFNEELFSLGTIEKATL